MCNKGIFLYYKTTTPSGKGGSEAIQRMESQTAKNWQHVILAVSAPVETSKHKSDSYWLTIWSESINVCATDQSAFNLRLVKSTF